MSLLKHWIWLSTRHTDSVYQLLEDYGSPEAIYYTKDLKAPTLGDKNLDPCERIIESCEKLGASILTIQDTQYPERLKAIFRPPLVLYCLGRMPVIDEEVPLSVVGCREMSAYGHKMAFDLSYKLAKAGMLIVSGMAKGIDASAHNGALRAGKQTLAVLGCGVDIAYPPENKSLYEDIISAGVVLSEFPPGIRPLPSNFPKRNRIISGLSLGVLVVEASARSGSLITAKLAAEQGRDVFACPGNADNPNSTGCNLLIQEGAALVMREEDVLMEYVNNYRHKISLDKQIPPPIMGTAPNKKNGSQGGKKGVKTEAKIEEPAVMPSIDKYPESQKRILLAIGQEGKTVDEIIEILSLPAKDILSELTMLEIDGVVSQMPGKRFVLGTGL